jgi:hypothetical protein
MTAYNPFEVRPIVEYGKWEKATKTAPQSFY